MTRYAVSGANRTAREWAAYRLRLRALVGIGDCVIDWSVDPPELVFDWTLSANELALLGSLPTTISTATMPMAGVTTTSGTPGHPDLAGHTALGLDIPHAHPYEPAGTTATHALTPHAGSHPDLATHESLGLSPAHDHDFAATSHAHGEYEPVHAHPYAATAHNHEASYAPTHGNPYAATSHAHVDGDLPAGIARDAEVAAAYSPIGHTHGGGASAWTTVVKLADESKNALTTVADDATLQFPTVANTAYAIRLQAQFLTNATADLKYRLVHTGTTTRVRRRVRRTATTDIAQTIELKTAFDAADVILSTTGLNPWLEEDIVLQVGASPGVVKIQWAQVTSNAGPTTCLEGSYLEYAIS